jgi:hypothetical protein
MTSTSQIAVPKVYGRRTLHDTLSDWRAFLRDAVWKRDEDLEAWEAALTFFRFFRSRHVVDLRIIFLSAATILALDLTIALVLAFFEPTIHLLFKHMAPAIYHFLSDRSAYKITPDDIFWFFGHTLEVLFIQIPKTLVTFLAPAIPLCGGVMAWTYLSATTRLGVVDLFACEIRTLCRVGAVFDISNIYLAQHKRCVEMIEGHQGDQPFAEGQSTSESKEEYFPVFSSNSHDLEALEAMVVGNITEFYTYMKAARDLLRRLAENKSAESAKPILENLIYVLFLGYESARKAIKDLIEFQPARAENMIVVLLTELPCYGFLRNHFKTGEGDQIRRDRLNLREDDYKDEVPRLIWQVSRHAEQRDWTAAAKSIEELGRRYKSALSEDLQQAMARFKEKDKLPARAAAP